MTYFLSLVMVDNLLLHQHTSILKSSSVNRKLQSICKCQEIRKFEINKKLNAVKISYLSMHYTVCKN